MSASDLKRGTHVACVAPRVDWGGQKSRASQYYWQDLELWLLSQEKAENIAQPPVNVLFNPGTIAKKDVWEINIVQILELLIDILKKADKKDLRVAGMAALSSSLIHRMKVERIFALQKAAMEKKPLRERRDVDIQILNIPYRHEATYPVTLDELLNLLENLIGTIANPRSRRGSQLRFEPAEVPDFKDYFVSLESIIGKYEDLILRKIGDVGFGFLHSIITDLDTTDSIRCFFAILFLARDQKVDLEQVEDDIKITIIGQNVGV